MANYRFGRKIASGGFGVVYEAVRDDGLKCAIKRLESPTGPDELARFSREVRIQAKLKHKNIVPLIGVQMARTSPWFAMPRAKMNLREYLAAHGAGEEHLWVFEQACEGLAYAHANGVIHRDLKPENILLFEDSEDGEPFPAIGDFGLGRFVERDSPSLTQSDEWLGTLLYIAPEQFRSAKEATQLSDIYSLGKILYELLTGETPYPQMDMAKVPRRFAYIIQKASATKPEDRFQSVEELLESIRLVTKGARSLTQPAEIVKSEVQAIMDGGDLSKKRVGTLAQLLVEHSEDNVVLSNILPRIPDPLLKALVTYHSSLLLPVVQAYDASVSGDLPFDYCDVVADFYEKLFKWTDLDQFKLIVLNRLPTLGATHNRWHVGAVFARIVASLDDPALILAVSDHLSKHPEVAVWNREYLEKRSIPTAIRRALRASTP